MHFRNYGVINLMRHKQTYYLKCMIVNLSLTPCQMWFLHLFIMFFKLYLVAMPLTSGFPILIRLFYLLISCSDSSRKVHFRTNLLIYRFHPNS